MPHLPAFMARYPDIDLDIVSTDETVNMIDAGVDVAIRTGVMPDSSLMARRLAPHRRIVCGSPAYFGRRGTPSTPDDLPAHDTLRLSLMPDDKWSFTRRRADLRSAQRAPEQVMVELKGRLRADDQEAVLALAVAGCGLALLPTWLASADLRAGKLQQVLPEWEARIGRAEPAVWAAYPPKKIVSSKKSFRPKCAPSWTSTRKRSASRRTGTTDSSRSAPLNGRSGCPACADTSASPHPGSESRTRCHRFH